MAIHTYPRLHSITYSKSNGKPRSWRSAAVSLRMSPSHQLMYLERFGAMPMISKWVFKTALTTDCTMQYTARRIIQSDEQIDKGETYAPVGKLTMF